MYKFLKIHKFVNILVIIRLYVWLVWPVAAYCKLIFSLGFIFYSPFMWELTVIPTHSGCAYVGILYFMVARVFLC